MHAAIAGLPRSAPLGRVEKIAGPTLRVTGLAEHASLGDRCRVLQKDGQEVGAEIVALETNNVLVLSEGPPEGVSLGDGVVLSGKGQIAPDESWIGRVVDPYGNPMDGRPLLPGLVPRPLHPAPINPTERRMLGARLETGLSVFNTMLPIVRGQRLGLFAGSGVGKSTLLGMLADGVHTDLVVIAMIGERSREIREFIERVLGPGGLAKSIVVAATSEQSALCRRRCAWSAMVVAEHFRAEGRQVMLLADSITRFADAHREIALASGEPAALRGYPASTAPLITALCERAGPGREGEGDITALLTVLVPGSDMEEPVADILRGVLDGHVVLDRKIAERGRFPAIDLSRSVSRALPEAASPEENAVIAEARRMLGAYERSEMMIRAGLYASGSDPELDAAIRVWPAIDAFIARREHDDTAKSFAALEGALSQARAGETTAEEDQSG